MSNLDANYLMRLSLPITSALQSRWTTFTSPKLQWNLGSATPSCFMSSLPEDTHGDLSKFDPKWREDVDATRPNAISSSSATSRVSDGKLVPYSTKLLVVTAKDDGSGVEEPQYKRQSKPQNPLWNEVAVYHPFEIVQQRLGFYMRSGETTSSTSLVTTEESPAKLKSKVLAALRRGDSYELLSSLLLAVEGPAFINSFPGTTILQILRLLDPKDFIEPYHQLFRYIPPKIQLLVTGGPNATFYLWEDVKSAYKFIVQNVAQREDLQFQKYEILLMIARATGDGALATQTWNDMLMRKYKPDVMCYNYYLEALCWPYGYDPSKPHYMTSGHHSGVTTVVSGVYTHMVQNGVMADATTFGHLMTAFSREGDLERVKIILKSIWRVDVDAIMETDDNSKSLDDVPPDSPLFPTPDLLFTIAHVFGSRNHLAVGLRVVDCISRRFAVPIGDRTANELAMWTFILSRRSSRHKTPKVWEKVPKWSMDFWTNMSTVTTLDMQVWYMVLKMYKHRHMLGAAVSLLITGHLNYEISHSKLHWRLRKLADHSHKGVIIHDFSGRRYRASMAALKEHRDHKLVSLGFKLVLRTKWRCWNSNWRTVAWQRQMLPQVVDLFWSYRYRARGAGYIMDTGNVRLESRTMHQIERRDFDLNEYLGMRIDASPDIDDPSAALSRTELDFTF